MGWSGIDVIPIRGLETAEQAVDRVYGGGLAFDLMTDDDGTSTVQEVDAGPPAQPFGLVTRVDRTWMLYARAILEEVMPGWVAKVTHKMPGRRWPHMFELVHPGLLFWCDLCNDRLNFNTYRHTPVDDLSWSAWWDALCRFAELPSVVFEGDGCVTYDIDCGLTAEEARKVHTWG